MAHASCQRPPTWDYADPLLPPLSRIGQALHDTIVDTWPGVTPRVCLFHYTQALWRNQQRTDLVPQCQVEGSEVRKSFKMTAALPFIPEDVLPTA